jgi:hypothetical protein
MILDQPLLSLKPSIFDSVVTKLRTLAHFNIKELKLELILNSPHPYNSNFESTTNIIFERPQPNLIPISNLIQPVNLNLFTSV